MHKLTAAFDACIHQKLLITPRHFSNPQGVGTLIFSSYVGSGLAFTVYHQKYQEFQAPQKIFEI